MGRSFKRHQILTHVKILEYTLLCATWKKVKHTAFRFCMDGIKLVTRFGALENVTFENKTSASLNISKYLPDREY